MHQAYVDINGTKTKVVTWGRWIEENPLSNDKQDIIICIPGNPGVTKYYTMFLQTIYEQLGCPVWIVGHSGHEPPTNNKIDKNLRLKGNEALYGLQGQIEHKVEFIKKYVPENANIHFIGHSIGAYIILQLLKIPNINSKVVGNYLLFPTIEYMSDTKNGIFLTKIIKHIVWFILFLSWIYTILPLTIQTFLMYIYFKLNCIPKMHLKTTRNFINPSVLEKVFFMALDEMDLVKKRDDDVLKKNINKIKLYYSANDNWAPVTYCNKLKSEIPDIDAQICVRKFEHAFILRNSRDVGNMVATWIKEKL